MDRHLGVWNRREGQLGRNVESVQLDGPSFRGSLRALVEAFVISTLLEALKLSSSAPAWSFNLRMS